MEEQSEQQKFAVLIDGDNAQAFLLPQILAEVSKETVSRHGYIRLMPELCLAVGQSYNEPEIHKGGGWTCHKKT